MISDENRKLIEDKLAEWQKELVPSSYAVYVAVAVILLGALLFYAMRRKRNNAVKQ
jgi:LPXTG-motif cell wall-anchored protein